MGAQFWSFWPDWVGLGQAPSCVVRLVGSWLLAGWLVWDGQCWGGWALLCVVSHGPVIGSRRRHICTWVSSQVCAETKPSYCPKQTWAQSAKDGEIQPMHWWEEVESHLRVARVENHSYLCNRSIKSASENAQNPWNDILLRYQQQRSWWWVSLQVNFSSFFPPEFCTTYIFFIT